MALLREYTIIRSTTSRIVVRTNSQEIFRGQKFDNSKSTSRFIQKNTLICDKCLLYNI
jgi:hypothetical protein